MAQNTDTSASPEVVNVEMIVQDVLPLKKKKKREPDITPARFT